MNQESLDDLIKTAASILLPAAVGSAIAGGAGLYGASKIRDEDEDEEERRKRLLSNAALAASLGGIAGAGLGSMNNTLGDPASLVSKEVESKPEPYNALDVGGGVVTGVATNRFLRRGLPAIAYHNRRNQGILSNIPKIMAGAVGDTAITRLDLEEMLRGMEHPAVDPSIRERITRLDQDGVKDRLQTILKDFTDNPGKGGANTLRDWVASGIGQREGGSLSLAGYNTATANAIKDVLEGNVENLDPTTLDLLKNNTDHRSLKALFSRANTMNELRKLRGRQSIHDYLVNSMGLTADEADRLFSKFTTNLSAMDSSPDEDTFAEVGRFYNDNRRQELARLDAEIAARQTEIQRELRAPTEALRNAQAKLERDIAYLELNQNDPIESSIARDTVRKSEEEVRRINHRIAAITNSDADLQAQRAQVRSGNARFNANALTGEDFLTLRDAQSPILEPRPSPIHADLNTYLERRFPTQVNSNYANKVKHLSKISDVTKRTEALRALVKEELIKTRLGGFTPRQLLEAVREQSVRNLPFEERAQRRMAGNFVIPRLKPFIEGIKMDRALGRAAKGIKPDVKGKGLSWIGDAAKSLSRGGLETYGSSNYGIPAGRIIRGVKRVGGVGAGVYAGLTAMEALRKARNKPQQPK